jgi:hypothetical protein
VNLLQTDRRPALAIATVFFFGWLGILYAGADHPPPPGFALLVLIDLLAAAVVAWRVPTYVAWSRAQRPRRWLLALLEGAAAGLIVAGVVIPFGGEPSVQPSATAYVTWFAVLGAVGAANTLLIYGVSAYLARKAAARL